MEKNNTAESSLAAYSWLFSPLCIGPYFRKKVCPQGHSIRHTQGPLTGGAALLHYMFPLLGRELRRPCFIFSILPRFVGCGKAGFLLGCIAFRLLLRGNVSSGAGVVALSCQCFKNPVRGLFNGVPLGVFADSVGHFPLGMYQPLEYARGGNTYFVQSLAYLTNLRRTETVTRQGGPVKADVFLGEFFKAVFRLRTLRGDR